MLLIMCFETTVSLQKMLRILLSTFVIAFHALTDVYSKIQLTSIYLL